jgi:hypothetical protein
MYTLGAMLAVALDVLAFSKLLRAWPLQPADA